jgi:hypothetical protein
LILLSWKQEHEITNGRAASKPASVP